MQCAVQILQYTALDHSVVLPQQPKRDQVTFLVFPHHKQTRIFLLVTDTNFNFMEKFLLTLGDGYIIQALSYLRPHGPPGTQVTRVRIELHQPGSYCNN